MQPGGSWQSRESSVGVEEWTGKEMKGTQMNHGLESQITSHG